MNTTDKDIQVLEEMLVNGRPTRHGTETDKLTRDEFDALSNILSDFRDMRELLEAAVEIQFKNELFIDLGPRGWRGFIGNVRAGGISVTEHFNSALDAWREVKGENNGWRKENEM